MSPVRSAVAAHTDEELLRVRAVLTAEILAAIAVGRDDDDVWGRIEMLDAIGAELLHRAKLVHPFTD